MILPISEIEQQYPVSLRPFKSFLLREYLQYQILQLLFSGPHSDKFSFLGGTCLRIVYQNNRFSEDLDFDNRDLSPTAFDEVAMYLKRRLEQMGLEVEMENVFRGAYHCYIKFPGLLFQAGISGHREQKILIQLDTEHQGYDYTPEMKLINKFDVFQNIPTTPPAILLAQKFYALLNRKQPKGRDFYDITFLAAKNIRPDYGFLDMKIGVSSAEALREKVSAFCQQLDLQRIAADVRPFLFQAADIRRVEQFNEFIRMVPL